MRINTSNLILRLAALVLLLAGCTGIDPGLVSSPAETPTVSIPGDTPGALGGSIPLDLATPTQAVETPIPQLTLTETAPPTLTLSPSATLAPTPTGTPTPTLVEPVRFAVIGDYGEASNPGAAAVAALVDSWEPDFIVTTGDNNYPSGEASTIDENIGQFYHEYIYNYQGAYGEGSDELRFLPTLGNHDWNTQNAAPYFEYFTLPGNERYYTFISGPVEIFALNSDSREPDGVGRSSAQAQWLQAELANSETPWQIVVLHHAPYTSGGAHGPTEWAQWPYEDWGADAVLAGHEHVYERLEIGLIPYFVNGVGGGAIYNFGEPRPDSVVRYNDGYGAMLVEVTDVSMVFQFITTEGEVIDNIEVRR